MFPYFKLDVSDPSQRIQLVFFVAEGVIISGLYAGLRASRRRAEESDRATRALERQILQLSDSEQSRIGHDLHEGLGQHLTGIALLTQSLRRNLEDENSSEVDNARHVESLVTKAIVWTRDLASDLCNAAIEGGRLCPALQDLADGTAIRLNVRCIYRFDGNEGDDEDVAVPETDAVHIYRIAQQAIDDAVRHCNASNIVIRLVPESKKLWLKIEADGAPYAGASRAGEKNANLKTIKYRARAIGGMVKLVNRKGGGTLIACCFPYQAAKFVPLGSPKRPRQFARGVLSFSSNHLLNP